MTIRFNLEPLKTMTAFPYLGSTVTFNNSYWEDLCGNMRKAQQHWGMVKKVLTKTGVML